MALVFAAVCSVCFYDSQRLVAGRLLRFAQDAAPTALWLILLFLGALSAVQANQSTFFTFVESPELLSKPISNCL